MELVVGSLGGPYNTTAKLVCYECAGPGTGMVPVLSGEQDPVCLHWRPLFWWFRTCVWCPPGIGPWCLFSSRYRLQEANRSRNKLCRHHGLEYHLFADDSQLYVSFRVNSREDLDRFWPALHQTAYWTSKHSCRRADCVWMMGRQRWLCCHHLQTATDSACQSYRPVVVWLHRFLPHVTSVSLSTATYRWGSTSLQSAERHTQSSAATLPLSLVISKLGYGNCLLYNLPDRLLHRLQLVQNSAARMVCRVRRMIVSPLPCVICAGCPSNSASTRFCVSSSKHCTVMPLNTCGCAEALPTSETLAIGKLESACQACAPQWPCNYLATVHIYTICHSGTPS